MFEFCLIKLTQCQPNVIYAASQSVQGSISRRLCRSNATRQAWSDGKFARVVCVSPVGMGPTRSPPAHSVLPSIPPAAAPLSPSFTVSLSFLGLWTGWPHSLVHPCPISYTSVVRSATSPLSLHLLFYPPLSIVPPNLSHFSLVSLLTSHKPFSLLPPSASLSLPPPFIAPFPLVYPLLSSSLQPLSFQWSESITPKLLGKTMVLPLLTASALW